MDDETYDLLSNLALPNVHLLQLRVLETDELKRVKPSRTKGEYCWTLTPFTPRFVFEADSSVSRVTYLDADVWLRKKTDAIFIEFEASKKHVLITDHGYAPEHDQSASSGQYCVQFMTFTRAGEVVRKWWELRCIEWCFARHEDGKFGDQKYLDDWPERFANQVHVLDNKELVMAPWNATRFPYGNSVLWHFHGLRLFRKWGGQLAANLGAYPIPEPAINYVYRSYIDDLREAVDMLSKKNRVITSQVEMTALVRMKAMLRGLVDQLWRIRNHRVLRL
ncbi:MAG: hypothetical protein V7752_06895 [Halopseudomonas sp.]